MPRFQSSHALRSTRSLPPSGVGRGAVVIVCFVAWLGLLGAAFAAHLRARALGQQLERRVPLHLRSTLKRG